MKFNATPAPEIPSARQRNAAALFGLWMAVVVIKFGNPVTLVASRPGARGGDLLRAPENTFEFLLTSWPWSWSFVLLGLLGVAALFVWRWKWTQPAVGLALPVLWFGWQLVSATQTVDPGLTRATLLHFGACLVCFWIGLCALSEVRDLRPVWWGLAVGLFVVLWTALDQHFGGLEATRIAAEKSQDLLPPELRAQFDTPEFRAKLASKRVFGTFVYPNALAGAILLLLPAALAGVWNGTRHPWLRAILAFVGAAFGAGALYWSGSKSGWLIAVVLGALALWRARLKPVLKLSLMAALLAAGGFGFLGRHAAYFEKGATSLAARGDYWQAARKMIAARPILGYGPGTFQIQYRELKPPEAEMAKLAHNDYLQQGCDSGIPAMLAYVGFIAGSILWLGLRIGAFCWNWNWNAATTEGVTRGESVQAFAVWLGAMGFAVQSVVEFGLYIPALACPFFLLLGWLWGRHGTRPAE